MCIYIYVDIYLYIILYTNIYIYIYIWIHAYLYSTIQFDDSVQYDDSIQFNGPIQRSTCSRSHCAERCFFEALSALRRTKASMLRRSHHEFVPFERPEFVSMGRLIKPRVYL